MVGTDGGAEGGEGAGDGGGGAGLIDAAPGVIDTTTTAITFLESSGQVMRYERDCRTLLPASVLLPHSQGDAVWQVTAMQACP